MYSCRMGQTSCSSEIGENFDFRSGGPRQRGGWVRRLSPLPDGALCRMMGKNVEQKWAANVSVIHSPFWIGIDLS